MSSITRKSRYRTSLRYEVDADRLGLIISFVAVAEHLSFVDAANELNVMSSTISRQISKLEDSLGVRLLARTTRRVSLTEAGELYLKECRGLLQRMAEADVMVSALNSEPRGYLRISVPVSLGRLHINAAIAAFLNMHPNVQIEADFSDRFVDMVGEGYDLVVRTAVLPSSGLIAKKVGTNHRVLVASPRYISLHGVPQIPQDLLRHNCLRYSHYSGSGGHWQLTNGAETEVIEVGGNFISNNSDAVYGAAVNGLGIALVARYLAYDHIQSGQLVPLLQGWASEPAPGIYLMYPSTKYLAPKVSAFSALLADHFKNDFLDNGRPPREHVPILDDFS